MNFSDFRDLADNPRLYAELAAALTDSAFDILGEAGGITLSQGDRRCIFGMVFYLLNEMEAKSQPDPVVQVVHLAAELASAIRDLRYTSDLIDDLGGRCAHFVEKMRDEVNAQKKRGPRQRTECDDIILGIAHVYWEAGGVLIGDGRFNKFIRTLYKTLPSHLAPTLANSEAAMLTRLEGLRPEIRYRQSVGFNV